MINFRPVPYLLLLSFGLSSCAGPRLAKPIGAFQASTEASIGAISEYYNDLNSFERRVYFEDLYSDPEKEVLITDKNGKRTALLGKKFSPQSIRARLDALTLVSLYAKRLADLAGSEAPTKFSQNINILGDNLSKLDQTFKELSHADTTAAAYIGPIATLVGLVGQIYLENRRDKALEAAVREGNEPVTKILGLVESDLVEVIEPLRATGEKEMIVSLATNYNNNRAKMSPAERRKALDDIRDRVEEYEVFLLNQPSGLVAGMREAHEALVNFASSPRKPQDFAELLAALETFQARVEVVANAILQLRKA